MGLRLGDRCGPFQIVGWAGVNHIRVLVLDDHELVRRGLRDALGSEEDLDLVADVRTGAEALAVIDAEKIDVAILDVRLDGEDGVTVCREIRSRSPETRCLMLTTFGGDEALYQSVLAGASGFLLKGDRISELTQSIRQVAAGATLFDPSMAARLVARMSGSAPDPTAVLTEQERRIFDLMAEGMSNKEIADTIHLAEQTVKNYASNVFSKLGIQRRAQAAALKAKSEWPPGQGGP